MYIATKRVYKENTKGPSTPIYTADDVHARNVGIFLEP
jgi:hypothetical protein